jgi:hypothetical protein
MILNKSFKVPIDGFTTKSRLVSYFSQNGWEQVEINPLLKFRRGSKKATWYAVNQAKLYTEVTIQIKYDNGISEIDSLFNIDTRGQMIIQEDREFWDSEIGNLEAAINNKTLPFTGSFERGNSFSQKFKNNIRIQLVELFTAGIITVILGVAYNLWFPESIRKQFGGIFFPILIACAFVISHIVISRYFRNKKH